MFRVQWYNGWTKLPRDQSQWNFMLLDESFPSSLFMDPWRTSQLKLSLPYSQLLCQTAECLFLSKLMPCDGHMAYEMKYKGGRSYS